jgi:hypothetical protein
MDPEVHGWRRCFKSDEFSETIRAALARWGRGPHGREPQGSTDEELLELLSRASNLPEPDSYTVDGGRITSEPGEILSFVRAALARYGRPAIKPVAPMDNEQS